MPSRPSRQCLVGIITIATNLEASCKTKLTTSYECLEPMMCSCYSLTIPFFSTVNNIFSLLSFWKQSTGQPALLESGRDGERVADLPTLWFYQTTSITGTSLDQFAQLLLLAIDCNDRILLSPITPTMDQVCSVKLNLSCLQISQTFTILYIFALTEWMIGRQISKSPFFWIIQPL